MFFSFLKYNENLIKEYFGKNIQYKEKFNNFSKMNTEQEEEQKNELFNIIKNDINDNRDKLYNIIASFYYLLFYKFKDSKQFKDMTNIGNAYLNLILKNFVIFLDRKLNYKDKNLFELLTGLYSIDVKNLVNQKFYNEKNINYSFSDIDSLLLSDEKIKKDYESLKNIFQKDFKDSFFTHAIKFLKSTLYEVILSDFEQNLKLIAFEEKIYSNCITIIIDGFISEDSDQVNNWKDLINFFKNQTMFFFSNGLVILRIIY